MKAAIIFLLNFTLASQTFGWGDMGHSSVGHLAERNLTPEGKAFIYSIMGAEPMGLSATFPDAVRNDSRFSDFAAYHFLEIPAGTTYGKVPSNRVAAKSADTIIELAPQSILLKAHKTLSLQQKQILLRYFIHVVGDVHQPLHIGNGVDMGANLCSVKVPDNKGGFTFSNLHSAWDDVLVDQIKQEIIDEAKKAGHPIKYFSFQNFVDALVKEAQDNGSYDELAQLAKTTTKADWFNESQSLHAKVYPDATPTAPTERPYCRIVNPETGKVEDGKFDESKIPTLSQDYVKEAHSIIKRRIILGGLRLANEINKMALVRGSKPWSDEQEARFFEKIKLENVETRKPSSVKTKAHSHADHRDWCHHTHSDHPQTK